MENTLLFLYYIPIGLPVWVSCLVTYVRSGRVVQPGATSLTRTVDRHKESTCHHQSRELKHRASQNI